MVECEFFNQSSHQKNINKFCDKRDRNDSRLIVLQTFRRLSTVKRNFVSVENGVQNKNLIILYFAKNRPWFFRIFLTIMFAWPRIIISESNRFINRKTNLKYYQVKFSNFHESCFLLVLTWCQVLGWNDIVFSGSEMIHTHNKLLVIDHVADHHTCWVRHGTQLDRYTMSWGNDRAEFN